MLKSSNIMQGTAAFLFKQLTENFNNKVNKEEKRSATIAQIEQAVEAGEISREFSITLYHQFGIKDSEVLNYQADIEIFDTLTPG